MNSTTKKTNNDDFDHERDNENIIERLQPICSPFSVVLHC